MFDTEEKNIWNKLFLNTFKDMWKYLKNKMESKDILLKKIKYKEMKKKTEDGYK